MKDIDPVKFALLAHDLRAAVAEEMRTGATISEARAGQIEATYAVKEAKRALDLYVADCCGILLDVHLLDRPVR